MSSALPPSLEELITELTRMPGVGRRTAQRLALHLVRADAEPARSLSRALATAAERLVTCETCHGMSETPQCAICSDPRRDAATLCVVEQATDVLLIEAGAAFGGRYHVLGGALSPIDGVDPDDLQLADLRRRAEAGDLTEVIVATSPTVSGEATAAYIADMLGPDVRLSRLASGMPVGVDMEHIDELTLSRAFADRGSLHR